MRLHRGGLRLGGGGLVRAGARSVSPSMVGGKPKVGGDTVAGWLTGGIHLSAEEGQGKAGPRLAVSGRERSAWLASCMETGLGPERGEEGERERGVGRPEAAQEKKGEILSFFLVFIFVNSFAKSKQMPF